MEKEQSHKSYRPLTVLTFRLNYLLHELQPLGYHLVNLLLHAGVTLLYHSLCARLLSRPAAALAALLFAVHPVHTEAVTGVVGRAELLASLFFLSALLQYARITSPSATTAASGQRGSSSSSHNSVAWRGLMWVSLLVGMSMLCKEQGITVIAVCALHEIFVAQKLSHRDFIALGEAVAGGGKVVSLPGWLRPTGQRLALLSLTGLCLLLGRLRIMGSQLPVFTKFDNPAAVADTPTRQLTHNYLLGLNAWLLLVPTDLCCDWTMNSVPLVRSVSDPRNLATICFYVVLFHLAWRGVAASPRHEAAVILTGLGLLVLPFLPASNLFFPVGFVVAERILYLPSMGFSLLVAFGCDKLFQRGGVWLRSLVVIALGLTLASHSSKTVLRNLDWRDEYSLFRSGLKVNAGNAKLFNNVGHALESQGQYAEALEYFHAAVTVQPDDIGAHINVGRTYNHMARFQEAEEAYLKAKSLLPRPKPGETYQARVAPNHLNVFLNLATLIAKNGSRLEEADLLYRQAISMRSDYTQAYINRGDILLKLNRTKEAQEVYERALFYDSQNPGWTFLFSNKIIC
jgi:protein O-mannosyl-transferase